MLSKWRLPYRSLAGCSKRIGIDLIIVHGHGTQQLVRRLEREASETCCFGLNALDQSSRRCNFECPTSGKITVLAQCNSNSQILVQVCRVLQKILAWKNEAFVQEPQYEGFNNVFVLK